MSGGRITAAAIDAWRFVVVLALGAWWGALTFYGAVVVPEGTEQLGSQTQGLVTQQVTRTLNLIGVAAAALSFVELRRCGARRAWAAWLVFVFCQAALFGIHSWLSKLLATGADRRWFYDVHRIYLFTTAAQWGAAPFLLWTILRSPARTGDFEEPSVPAIATDH